MNSRKADISRSKGSIRNSVLPLLILIIITMLFSSCVHNSVADFHFLQYSGRKMSFSQESDVKPQGTQEQGESLLQYTATGVSTPFYRLDEVVKVEERGRSFFIVYSSDTPLQLELKINSIDRTIEMPFMSGREIEFRVALDANDLLEGFRISGSSGGGMLDIQGTGIDDSYSGITIDNSQVLIGGNIQPFVLYDGKIKELAFTPPALSNISLPGETNREGFLRLRLESTGKAPAEFSFYDTENRMNRVEFTHSRGTGVYDFHYSVLGFVPVKVELDADDASITAAEFLSMADHKGPVDIDFSSLLVYPRELWRQDEFELFRWSLAPEILVFDFADYGIQSAFLKRMAFFVEKEGVRGTLLANEVLEPLHGWNAHDYRAEDIARFFSTAIDEGFALNPEEEKLAQILVENRVISKDENRYLPLSGGFLSITRESPPYLRHLFLTHEGCHGLFFTDAGLRQESQKLWDSFSPVEQNFWRTFFSWKGYDPEDEYLVVNELQAYLLQQSVAGADPYYIDYTLPRMVSVYPASAPVVDALLTENPLHFTAAAGVLDEYLTNRWGVRAGNLSHLIFKFN